MVEILATTFLAPSGGRPCSLATVNVGSRTYLATRILRDRVHLLSCEKGASAGAPHRLSLRAVYHFPAPVQCIDFATNVQNEASLVAATRDGNLWARPLAAIGNEGGEHGTVCGGVWVERCVPAQHCFARQPAVRAVRAFGHGGGVAVLATSLVAATRGFAANGAAAGSPAHCYDSLEGGRATCVVCLRSDAGHCSASSPDTQALDARMYTALFGGGGGAGRPPAPGPVVLQGDTDGSVRWCFLNNGNAAAVMGGNEGSGGVLLRLDEPVHAIVPVRLARQAQAHDGLAIVTSGGKIAVVEMDGNDVRIAHRPRIAAPVLSVCASASGKMLLHCSSLGAVFATAVTGAAAGVASAQTNASTPLPLLGRAWCVRPCGVYDSAASQPKPKQPSSAPPSAATGPVSDGVVVLERSGRLVWLDIAVKKDTRVCAGSAHGRSADSVVEGGRYDRDGGAQLRPEVQIQNTLASLGRMSAHVAALTAMNAAGSNKLGAINDAIRAQHRHQIVSQRPREPAPEGPAAKKRRRKGKNKKAKLPFSCQVRPVLHERPRAASLCFLRGAGSCGTRKWLQVSVGPGSAPLPRDVRWNIVVQLREGSVRCGGVEDSGMCQSFHFPLWKDQPSATEDDRSRAYVAASAALKERKATSKWSWGVELPIDEGFCRTPIVAKVWLSFMDYIYPRRGCISAAGDLGGGTVSLLLYSGRLDAADFVRPPGPAAGTVATGPEPAHASHWHAQHTAAISTPQRAANAWLHLAARTQPAGEGAAAAFGAHKLLGGHGAGALARGASGCVGPGRHTLLNAGRGPLCISVPVSAGMLACIQESLPRMPGREQCHVAQCILRSLLSSLPNVNNANGAELAMATQCPWRIEVFNAVTTGNVGMVAVARAVTESGHSVCVQCRLSPSAGDSSGASTIDLEIHDGAVALIEEQDSDTCENLLLLREALLYRMQRLFQRALPRSNGRSIASQPRLSRAYAVSNAASTKGPVQEGASVSALLRLENEVLMLQQSAVPNGSRVVHALPLPARVAAARRIMQQVFLLHGILRQRD